MALLTTASALVAPRPLTARPRRPTPKATMQMGLKDTIGNIFVPPPPPPPVTVVEGAENFRLLGVPPNAEYDEVQQAVKALKEKYAGDTKRLLKIDVAKDKIAERPESGAQLAMVDVRRARDSNRPGVGRFSRPGRDASPARSERPPRPR